MGERFEIKEFASPIECVEADHLTINREYMAILASLGFDDFDSIWHYQDGETVKHIDARSVIRIKLNVQDKERIFYLKRHNMEFTGIRALIAPFFPMWPLSQGQIEFENICDFRRHNLATVIPVAAGERRSRFFWVESFLITEDFSPFLSLEKILREKPDFFTGSRGENCKRILLKEIACLARRMHESGFNHLDFNATHILLSYENGSEVPHLALFDLQRIDKKKCFRYRWMIKSLARLNYTLPEGLFTLEDRVSLLLNYKDRKRLNLLDRFQWYFLGRKTNKIRRHTEKVKRSRDSKVQGF